MYADLKNDYVFRRIFTRRPDLLCGLLNDLLERPEDQRIESIEYLPSEQTPLAAGAKYSVLDVRCRDRSGTTFVVEMQLLHTAGFESRVVYNACRAYVGQLGAGEPYTKLADVVAISICDFVLWPDAERDAAGLPRVPMLSRWNLTERSSGSPGPLFVNLRRLKEPLVDLPPGPYGDVVALTHEATFTSLELEAYRHVMDEITVTRDWGELLDRWLDRAFTASEVDEVFAASG